MPHACPHQVLAIANILHALGAQRATGIPARAQAIMACGTGKTLVSQRIAEALHLQTLQSASRVRSGVEGGPVPGANTVLVCLPSLSLVKQTLTSYLRFATQEITPLVVCSAADAVKSARHKAAKDAIDEITDTDLFDRPPTTDPRAVAEFFTAAHSGPHRLHVVFSTYQSSKVVSKAQSLLASKGTPHRFALSIADEAHNLAGIHDRAYSTILHESLIASDNRVFMTATQKFFDIPGNKDNGFKRNGHIDKSPAPRIATMDDEAVFGPVAHVLGFRDAVRQGLLVDYKVLIMEVTQSEVATWLAETRTQRGSTRGRVYVAGAEQGYAQEKDAISKIALSKAIHEFSLRRVISYHSRVDDAEAFVGNDGRRGGGYQRTCPSLAEVAEQLYPKARAGGSISIIADCVSSRVPSKRRSEILSAFDSDSPVPHVLSSVNCLGEGVDLPNLDGALFADPRSSDINITQIIGRVMRLPTVPGTKDFGCILLPVLVDDRVSVELRMESNSYDKVWRVISALTALDGGLDTEIRSIRSLLKGEFKKALLDAKSITELPEDIQAAFASAQALISEHVVMLQANAGTWSARRAGTIPVEKLAAHVVLRIAGECSQGVDTVKVDVSNPAELRLYADAYKAEFGKLPNTRSGRIKGTEDLWKNVDVRLRLAGAHSGLSTAFTDLYGRPDKIDETDLAELRRYADAYRVEFGKLPGALSGDIKGTDDSWGAVYRRLCNAGGNLSKTFTELYGSPLKVNETDTAELMRYADAYKAEFGKLPSSLSGDIRGTADTWQRVDSRMKTKPGGSSLSKTLTRLYHRSVKVDETNPAELRRYAALYKAEFGESPNLKSGNIRGTSDTWAGVGGRLRVKGGSLPQSFSEMFSGHARVAEADPVDLRRHADAHRAESGKLPSANSGDIKGTVDTWQAVHDRLRKKDGGGLRQSLDALYGSPVKVDETNPLELLRYADAHKTEFGKLPTSASGPIRGTTDKWSAVNARLSRAGRTLPQVLAGLYGR